MLNSIEKIEYYNSKDISEKCLGKEIQQYKVIQTD